MKTLKYLKHKEGRQKEIVCVCVCLRGGGLGGTVREAEKLVENCFKVYDSIGSQVAEK